MPQKRDGVIFQLDTKTGQPAKTTPDKACFIEELYTQDDEGNPNRVLEAFFSIVENYAAQALNSFLADPSKLTPEDRQSLAYYFAFQYQRTPVAIEHSAASQQAMMAVMMGLQFAHAESFQQRYRERFEDGASDEEIESFRQKTMSMLKAGEIAFENPELGVFQMMLRTADTLASSVASLSWILVKAKKDEFITSDRALAMHDPKPKFPWSGHALQSSPEAQTTFPLTPEYCLCMAQLDRSFIGIEAEAEDVLELNLRTYGWASEFIYGRTQQIVQRIRTQAKSKPSLVIRPRTPKPVFLEEADPDDPTVGLEHVKRGWPPGLWVTDDDGNDRFCSYQLVDPQDQESIRKAISAEEELQRNFTAHRAEKG